MGCYINPPNMIKEDWLVKHAKRATPDEAIKTFENNTERPVVLLDNYTFTAAGVAYNPNELHEFLSPSDDRPRTLFIASVEDLKKVSDIEAYLK